MITPRTLQGFFDYLPEDMTLRQHVKDVWREVFERYGYGQLETPSLEHADILFGKYGEDEKLIYHFQDHGDRHVALRYDQTVPLARVAAQYLNSRIFLPFKRYEINRVWRADAARKARKREFYQCDADILGSNSLLCEAEIFTLLHDGFTKLKLNDHIISFCHRDILKAFVTQLKLPAEKSIEVFRAVDKLDKVGLNGVEDELKSRQIPDDIIPHILKFIDNKATSNQEILNKISQELAGNNQAEKAISALTELISYLKKAGLPESNYQVNPALVRGLDYYTGVVFEVTMPSFGNVSLAGGGRYDNLCQTFTKEHITGIGVGIGFEPICVALEENQLFTKSKTTTELLVTIFDEKLRHDTLEIALQLRQTGLHVETYLGDNDKLGKQFKYADKQHIPFALIYGDDEKAQKEILIKNMASGDQKKVEIPKFLKDPRKYLQ